MNTLIPPCDYYDPKVYVSEQELLFSRLWQCIGFTHELADHHDFVTAAGIFQQH